MSLPIKIDFFTNQDTGKLAQDVSMLYTCYGEKERHQHHFYYNSRSVT
jgi:hypothetical protein